MNHGRAAANTHQSAGAESLPWPEPRVAWTVTALLMLAYVASYADFGLLNLVVQPVKVSLKLSDTQMGLLLGPAFGLLYTLTTIPFGWLTDAVSRMRLIALGVAFWSAMTAACGLSTNFWQFFLARLGMGLGQATVLPAAPSLLADSFPPERRTLPLSLYVVAGGAGGFIAFIAGGFAAAHFHGQATVTAPIFGTVEPWQIIFLAASAPGFIIAVLFLLLREPARRSQGQAEPTLQELRRVLSSRRGILIPQTAGICLFQLQAFAVGAWTPAFFMRVHGWTLTDVGLKLGSAQLAMGVLGGAAAGWTARLLWRRGLRDANLITSALFLGGMVLPAIAGFLVPNEWLSFALLGLMTLFAHGPSGGSLASIQETIPNRLRGRVTAFYYTAVGLISRTCGPLIIGVMNDMFGNERIALSLAALSAVALPLGTGLLLIAARRRRDLDWTE